MTCSRGVVRGRTPCWSKQSSRVPSSGLRDPRLCQTQRKANRLATVHRWTLTAALQGDLRRRVRDSWNDDPWRSLMASVALAMIASILRQLSAHVLVSGLGSSGCQCNSDFRGSAAHLRRQMGHLRRQFPGHAAPSMIKWCYIAGQAIAVAALPLQSTVSRRK